MTQENSINGDDPRSQLTISSIARKGVLSIHLFLTDEFQELLLLFERLHAFRHIIAG
jgi:hypothetical protein